VILCNAVSLPAPRAPAFIFLNPSFFLLLGIWLFCGSSLGSGSRPHTFIVTSVINKKISALAFLSLSCLEELFPRIPRLLQEFNTKSTQTTRDEHYRISSLDHVIVRDGKEDFVVFLKDEKCLERN
jgi:hypothetical protein